MFNVSFIGTCMKRDSTLKLTSRSVGCNRIFWIFCMKSVELVMCDSNFPVRDCSVCARKRDKLSGSVCANNRSEWDCLVLLVVRIVLMGEDM